MSRLWWVMGASAVGKKTLMRAAVDSAAVRAALGFADRVQAVWLNDGDMVSDDEARLDGECAGDILMRWQFGRETAVDREDWRRHQHGVLLVEVDPSVHYARMQAREGDRWTPELLAGESGVVREMACQMARACSMPLRVVDASQGYRVVEAGV